MSVHSGLLHYPVQHAIPVRSCTQQGGWFNSVSLKKSQNMQDDFLKYRTNFGNGALGDIWAPCSDLRTPPSQPGTPTCWLHDVDSWWGNPGGRRIKTKISSMAIYDIYGYLSGWWYTYPSEKYEFVNWDDNFPNTRKNSCAKPPTSEISGYPRSIPQKQRLSLARLARRVEPGDGFVVGPNAGAVRVNQQATHAVVDHLVSTDGFFRQKSPCSMGKSPFHWETHHFQWENPLSTVMFNSDVHYISMEKIVIEAVKSLISPLKIVIEALKTLKMWLKLNHVWFDPLKSWVVSTKICNSTTKHDVTSPAKYSFNHRSSKSKAQKTVSERSLRTALRMTLNSQNDDSKDDSNAEMIIKMIQMLKWVQWPCSHGYFDDKLWLMDAADGLMNGKW